MEIKKINENTIKLESTNKRKQYFFIDSYALKSYLNFECILTCFTATKCIKNHIMKKKNKLESIQSKNKTVIEKIQKSNVYENENNTNN